VQQLPCVVPRISRSVNRSATSSYITRSRSNERMNCRKRDKTCSPVAFLSSFHHTFQVFELDTAIHLREAPTHLNRLIVNTQITNTYQTTTRTPRKPAKCVSQPFSSQRRLHCSQSPPQPPASQASTPQPPSSPATLYLSSSEPRTTFNRSKMSR
jgi:hypothetical protein